MAQPRGKRTRRTQSFLAIAKALADRNRVRALLALRDRELCACQIIELLALAPSTVSKHMSILKHARLVEDHKEGRWMFYRLPQNGDLAVVHDAIAWAENSLAETPEILDDTRRLKKILRRAPHEQCLKREKK
jgi:DNA-binding transcriptional ArsR family regulator